LANPDYDYNVGLLSLHTSGLYLYDKCRTCNGDLEICLVTKANHQSPVCGSYSSCSFCCNDFICSTLYHVIPINKTLVCNRSQTFGSDGSLLLQLCGNVQW